MAEITRDTALEEKMLAAVIADRRDVPRNKQVAVGPSSIGFCRELLRAQLFEAADQNISQETHWATAAHWGTVDGAELERIFGQRLGALEQQRITTLFERLGVSISGSMDLVFLDGNQVTDLKSTTDIGGVLYDLGKNAAAIETLLEIFRTGELYNRSIETPDGGYELTSRMVDAMSKLQYYVQIAIYVTGAIQAGVLAADAEGRLVFYDRAGEYQGFVALVVTAEEIALFYEIAQYRVAQVVAAQEFLDNGADLGQMQKVFSLRDQTPSFCFSPKVMCPLRERCWGGSDYEPVEILESADVSSSVDRYIEGRRMEKMGKGMKDAARDELKGISGKLGNGRMVSWVRGGSTINVVETGTPTQTPSEGASVPQAEVPQAQVPALPQPAPAAPSEGPADTEFGELVTYDQMVQPGHSDDEYEPVNLPGDYLEPPQPLRYISAVERELAEQDAAHVAHLQGLVDGALGKPSDPNAASREATNALMKSVAEQRRARGAR